MVCHVLILMLNLEIDIGYIYIELKLLFLVLCIAFKMYLSSHKSHDETLNLNLISQKSHCIFKHK